MYKIYTYVRLYIKFIIRLCYKASWKSDARNMYRLSNLATKTGLIWKNQPTL